MTPAESPKFKGVQSHPQGQPIGGLGFDRVTIALCGWFIGGLYLDGWAHNHIAEDLDPFFTPWHAVLYSGFFAVASWLVITLIRNHARGHEWRRSLPPSYDLSLLGVVIFAGDGLSDFVWHELCGIEIGIEALLSLTQSA